MDENAKIAPDAEQTNTESAKAETTGAGATETTATTTASTEPLYTAAQLEAFKAQWQQAYEQSKAEEQDFAKMTPVQQAKQLLEEQKAETARLQAALADRDLTDYARDQLQTAEMSVEALAFIKGKDRADTDAKLKAFGALLATGVQAGVEKRFQGNGYTPRGSAAGKAADAGKMRARGVVYNNQK